MKCERFVSAVGKCNFTHHTSYDDIVDAQLDPKSEALLDKMQQYYSKVFEEPIYPISENYVPFSIQLVDDKLPSPKKKLYPLSEPELWELHKQLKFIINNGINIPSASLYGALILFVAKKSSADHRIYIDYQSLNSNIITNSFPLPRIDELLVHL